MDPAELARVSTEALYLTLLLSAPVLGVSLVVGLGVSLLQAVTQVQEQTLTFVPKLIAVAVTLAVAGAFMGGELVRFTAQILRSLPELVP